MHAHLKPLRAPGVLLDNYSAAPLTILMPVIVILGLLVSIFFARTKMHPGITFTVSTLNVAAIIGTAGVSLFPFLLPFTSVPNDSLII